MAKLAILGTGFVGASLGLAIRPSKLFTSIVGYDRDRGRLQAAKRVGAVDDEARSPAAAVSEAAMVIATVPSAELDGLFREIADSLSAGAVVSDTSRWKLPAQRAAAALPEGVHFIGGRPILDNAGQGTEQANAAVLRNAVYCLTPGPSASETAINAMSAVVTAAGAQPYFLDAVEHDAFTAASELLPSALLACLPLTVTKDASWGDAGKLAGDSLARLADLAEQLDKSFWREAADNSASLARWLEATAATLLDLRDRLETGTDAELARDWESTLQALARWRRDKRQLQESTMPSKSELKPNLFGSLGRLRR